MRKLTLKQVSKTEYEYDIDGEEQDYHIRKDDPRFDGYPWHVDVFHSGKRNNDAAHILTETFAELEDALDYVFDEEAGK